MKKLRLWLIKKLNATPNELRIKNITTENYHIVPIYVEIDKRDLPVPPYDYKNEIIDMMKPELIKHLVCIDEPYIDTNMLRVKIDVVERD